MRPEPTRTTPARVRAITGERGRTLRCALFLIAAVAAAFVAPAACQTKFMQPTPQELSMTSLPGYPGVAAVILNKEEIVRDDMHVTFHYTRIKILTEDGKKYANVELSFVTTTSGYNSDEIGNDKSLDGIQARTIHPDGTIIPFTGKPYLKVIVKGKNIKYQAKVFTLPDVTVGSIIEYRYATHINDSGYESPTFIIQDELPLQSGHFVWYPTSEAMVDSHDVRITHITWFPILPAGTEVVRHDSPFRSYEITVKDVPPVPDEEFMPPLGNYSYRVYFNYVGASTPGEFWKTEGKYWSKSINSFANPDGDLRSATQQVIGPATTQDQKLRAIYAAVMALENTDFTREHDQREDKANDLGKVRKASDILEHKRGDSTQLTELFIAMARAAGMNADAMLVPDRSRHIFIPDWLDITQFDDTIAIVNFDGKDVFFDPGSRYCPYGHLAWQHTFLGGLRQKGNDVVFDRTPGDDYTANLVTRAGNLAMDATGHITGQIELGFAGSEGVHWRQAALTGDEQSLKNDLRSSIENMLPHTLEIKDIAVSNLADYEKPLNVVVNVDGTVGTWAGKRLVIPADIFVANTKATFPNDKRDVAVDFHYPHYMKDAVRIRFPNTFKIEAIPSSVTFQIPQTGGYAMQIEPSSGYFTTRREYAFNDFIVPSKDYPRLRTFYSQFESNDQQSVILKSGSGQSASAGAN